MDKTLININQDEDRIILDFSALHPDLKDFVENRNDKLETINTVKIIKYIVYCYDKESPLVRAYKGKWMVKKRESALAAGFERDINGLFTEEADIVIFCKDDSINRVILRYLYLLHDRLFQTYVIYNEMYLHQSVELMKYDFAQPGHAKSAKENLDTIGKDIEQLEWKIFSGEETKILKDLLYEDSINQFNELRPERIAVRIERGQGAVDYNPYGDYKKEEMRFMGDE